MGMQFRDPRGRRRGRLLHEQQVVTSARVPERERRDVLGHAGGDGIIDAGEECDPASSSTTRAAASACLLEAGCAKPRRLLHGRAFTAEWVSSRSTRRDNSETRRTDKDALSTCTEPDLYRENLPDDSDAKSNEDGKCYRGECISPEGNCIDPNTGAPSTLARSPPLLVFDEQKHGRSHSSTGAPRLTTASVITTAWTHEVRLGKVLHVRHRLGLGHGRPVRRSAAERLPRSFGEDGCWSVCVDEEGTEADPTALCAARAPPHGRLAVSWRRRSRRRRRCRLPTGRPCRPRRRRRRRSRPRP